MYLIINHTKKTCIEHKGCFPNFDEELNNGDNIIIVSLYSKTFKIATPLVLNGELEWQWKSFPIQENSKIVNESFEFLKS